MEKNTMQHAIQTVEENKQKSTLKEELMNDLKTLTKPKKKSYFEFAASILITLLFLSLMVYMMDTIFSKLSKKIYETSYKASHTLQQGVTILLIITALIALLSVIRQKATEGGLTAASGDSKVTGKRDKKLQMLSIFSGGMFMFLCCYLVLISI